MLPLLSRPTYVRSSIADSFTLLYDDQVFCLALSFCVTLSSQLVAVIDLSLQYPLLSSELVLGS